MSSTLPCAWELRKVGHDSRQGEHFTLRFLEPASSGAIWVADGRELNYEQARDCALARGITTGAFDGAVQRERLRFMRA